ncbi:hypothetical protein CRG98_020854 [Punica granatum]|uniref:Uncharacterized protein n=1 Tax=Punica granatum TaxID=22663 RepID=A0A2I0JR19_PUNGR|nr:hypothetical protein CRG98_020854 [Punica granatum]
MASRAITFYGFLTTLTFPRDEKIYMCSPPETTAGVIISPLGIQHNWPRTGQNRLRKPLFPAFFDFSRIPGLGIIIPDLEKLGLLRFLCVCGAIRRSMTDSHASLCFYVFLHRIMHVFIVYSASMSGNSLNQSRGVLVGLGKPKEPLGLTLREVAESLSWLPRAMDGLLSPT